MAPKDPAVAAVNDEVSLPCASAAALEFEDANLRGIVKLFDRK